MSYENKILEHSIIMPQVFHSVMKKKETKRITLMFAKNGMN